MDKLTLPQPFLRPFPEPETVFADPVEKYAKHILPLISIDLSAVDKSLSGWIHLVSPIEPYDGCLGDLTEPYWGPYLQSNWISFRLTTENRYELLGDFLFFALENPDVKANEPGAFEELTDYYAEMHEKFAKSKQTFAETGQVYNRAWRQPNPSLHRLGGKSPLSHARWEAVPDAAFTYKDGDSTPKTRDGRPYIFIASVAAYYYGAGGADDILLFYDPVERVALQTFIYT